MPTIKVDLLKGRSADQKREFAQVVTREAARILECAPAAVDVLFVEYEPSDWAVAGVPIADRKK